MQALALVHARVGVQSAKALGADMGRFYEQLAAPVLTNVRLAYQSTEEGGTAAAAGAGEGA